MKFSNLKRFLLMVNKIVIVTLIISLGNLNFSRETLATEVDEEMVKFVENIFISRNKAILEKDLELLDTLYATDTKYGQWAYEYEERKVKYLNNWAEKQGVKFIEIIPKVVIRSSKARRRKIFLQYIM